MTKSISLLFLALLASFASFATITGSSTICTSTPENYTDSGPAGGVWSSSNPSIAVVTSSSGATATVTGIVPGTATITYLVGATVSTQVVSVNTSPAPITGGSVSVCHGVGVTLSDVTPGGSWSVTTGSGYFATPGILSTYYTPGPPSVVTVLYTVGSCAATTTVTVNSTPHDSISGPNLVCTGSTVSLANTVAGGTWSSSDLSIATVSSSGVVTGIAPGSATISYTTTSACSPATEVLPITVTSTAITPSLLGPGVLAAGSSSVIFTSINGGVWSSSNPAVASVSTYGAGTGWMSALSAGTTTISYGVPSCGGGPTVYATHLLTVNAIDGISGYVHYSGLPTVRVWLVKFDPSTATLAAVDSLDLPYGMDSTYYSFNGLPTDSYRVKAAIISSGAAFVPTYYTSSYYWSSASVISHVSGTQDGYKNINMIPGTPVSGPGFIGGSVTTGANKGTTDGAPVSGMNVYLLNAATKAVIAYTTTDAAGNYSFANLPIGIYDVFPEELGYTTTPYLSVTLTSAASSMTAVKFMERTVSKKITPIGTVAVSDLGGSNTSVSAFPNPASGKLNINWDAATSEAATLIITDVTGREVMTKDFSMIKGNGAEVVDLSSLTNGMYFISVHSASISYISKIEVRH